MEKNNYYLGCAVITLGFFAGVYFIGRTNEPVYFRDTEQIIHKKTNNIDKFEELVETYESSDKNKGIIRGISNSKIDDLIESWRELPRNERLGIIKQFAQEESKEFLYGIGDSGNGSITALGIILSRGGEK